MKKRILIIDDDTKLAESSAEFLHKHAFSVALASHPREAMKQIAQEPWHLLVIAVALPDVSGIDLCKQIRERYQNPILLLTAQGNNSDRVHGLEAGADDCLDKPFTDKDLLSSVRGVLRAIRSKREAQILRSENLEVDLHSQKVSLDGNLLELTTSEYEVLTLLMKNPQRPYNRDQLMDALRGTTWEVTNRSLDILISRLRGKLHDDPKHPRFIRTIWGSGYCFAGQVDATSKAA